MRDLVASVVDAGLEATVVLSFSRVGYDVRSVLGGWIHPPSLARRRVVLTGATSGVGLAAAHQLAALGADVTLVGRSLERTRRAAEDVSRASGNANVVAREADLADLEAVARLGRDLREHGPWDVLIHNAGAITPEYRPSPQGYETTVAAQLLGPFLLTRLLEDSLRSGAPGRVITVASGGLYTQRFDLASLSPSTQDYDGVRAYALVKRAQLVLNHEWARRHQSLDVVHHAMHPGWTDTPGLAASLPSFHRAMRPFLRRPDQGADTITWLASDPTPVDSTAGFWLDRRRRREHKVPWTRGAPEDPGRLWRWCEERTAAFV